MQKFVANKYSTPGQLGAKIPLALTDSKRTISIGQASDYVFKEDQYDDKGNKI